MYVSVRHYHSRDVAEVARRAQESFLPLVREVAGFSAYYIVDEGGGAFSAITMAEDEIGVDESARKALDWVSKNAADLVESGPTVTSGEVVAHA